MRKSVPILQTKKPIAQQDQPQTTLTKNAQSRHSIRSTQSARFTHRFRNRPRVASTPSVASFHRRPSLTSRRRPSAVQSVVSLNNIAGDSSRKLTARQLGDHAKNRSKCAAIELFWHDFTSILFSPLFLRHRNVFILFMEIIAPALVALIIFAAFTSGVSWKMEQIKKNEANARVLNFNEVTMTDLTDNFRTLHTDSYSRVLIFFTPVDNFTCDVMQNTLDLLGVRDANMVFKNGEDSNSGAVGVPDAKEVMERAIYHRNERFTHGLPVGVIFKYNPDEKSQLTGIPYNVSYSISTFDKAISKTQDLYPFVRPATSIKWRTPYLTSGFLGMQYAIEESIIRLIIEKQKAVELEDMQKTAEAKARELLDDGNNEDHLLSAEDVDEDLLLFMIAETLKDIEMEKAKKQELLDFPSPEEEEEEEYIRRERFGGLGRLGLDDTQTGGAPRHRLRGVSSDADLPQRTMKAFSYDRMGEDYFSSLLTYVVVFSLVVAYSFMSFFIVRQIATEKLSGIRDLLQIHGLPAHVHWTMLFFHALVFRAITSGLILLTLKIDYGNGRIADASESDVLFVLIYIHQLALTFMNYFIGCCIKHVETACGIISVSCCVLSFYLPETFAAMKLVGGITDFVVSIIFPNWCFRHAMNCLMNHEANEKGVGWDNLMQVASTANALSVGEGMIQLVFIGLGYFFLAIYVGTTNKRTFPGPKNWYNFRDWIKKRRDTVRVKGEDLPINQQSKEIEDEDDFPRPPVYQDPHPDKDCLVKIRNLSKNYGKHRLALDSLSMDIMHEEITVILGHSGCGKTTLISILAGILAPSNGHASVNGYDVTKNTDQARQFLGVCPQKLIAFNLLTVREHIHLCYKLRGYKSQDCNRLVASMMTQLKLWNVRGSLPSNLTNDELRRLGIAMSMVDTPKVLLFDEPTMGMDTMGRREIWDIILSMRHHHTILLTTNYMDEAEHLADTLALLAHGRLVCCGTLNYLKSQYDTGYFLKLVPFVDKFVDANAVINFARSILGPKVEIKRHKRLKDVDTLELELPTNEMDHFADFCEELDKKMDALHIMKYSIRQVTLNDIFIKISSSVAADGYSVDLYVRRDSAGDIKTVLTSEIPEIPEGSEKNVSRTHQFVTLVKKAFTIWQMQKKNVLMHLIIPLLVIWVVVFQAKLFVQLKSGSPEMILNTKRFGSEHHLRVLAQVTDDDPVVNYKSHISRALGPFEEPVQKQDRVITKLYEALNEEHVQRGYVKDERMVAFEFGKKGRDLHFVGYHATGALHSPPVALNLMNNVILSALSEPERNRTPNWRPYSVTARNLPMPQVEEGQFERGCGITCALLALLMSFALAFILHASVVIPMFERSSGMKHLILMCNVEPAIYWFSEFVVDIIVMFIMSVIIVLIFLSDLYQTFHSPEVIAAVWIISSLYLMWSGLMYCYYIISVVSANVNCYNLLAVLHLFLGVIPFLLMTVARPDSGFGIFCRNVLLVLLPPYTITSALFHFFANSGQRNICRNINSFIQEICTEDRHKRETYSGHSGSRRSLDQDLKNIDPMLVRCCERICSNFSSNACYHPPSVFNASAESWEDPQLITDVIALFFQGFIFWGFLIMVERQVFPRLFQNVVHKFLQGGTRRRSDASEKDSRKFYHVQLEGAIVDQILQDETWPEDLALVCDNLTKSSSSTMIMKDFSLEVKKGQCIAILGRGNSGKSSIIRMIAGELMPTRGNVYIEKDLSLTSRRKEYLSRIGYCPQRSSFYTGFNAINMLQFMGRLRGIPSSILDTHINKWLSIMGLTEVANDKCKEYGDGIRQRMCAAMAFIGEPEIILLDEVTTGVDPCARERLWCVIEHLNQMGFTIIFTTYSTDEAFSLADKVVVVAEGGVQCIGHPDDIQETYARGHTITFQLRHDVITSQEMVQLLEGRIAEFKQHVQEIYRHIDLLDEHDEMLMYFLRDARLPWAEVFRRGHYLSIEYEDIIASYEVTEGGVDDIFVFLANKYHELAKPKAAANEEPKPEFLRRSFRRSRVGDELQELKKAESAYKRRNTLA